jgi:aspartate 1-decarboxylase
MLRRMMKSKIHRATVTDADLHYVGSITLDTELMQLADILEMEQVQILDIDNGARFETYAIPGGPGDVCLNGAAARLVAPGDRIIVITYAEYDQVELEHYAPRVVHVDTANRPVPEHVARELAAAAPVPGPIRYRTVEHDPAGSEVDWQTAADLDLLR